MGKGGGEIAFTASKLNEEAMGQGAAKDSRDLASILGGCICPTGERSTEGRAPAIVRTQREDQGESSMRWGPLMLKLNFSPKVI
jgi:hypothetical protein